MKQHGIEVPYIYILTQTSAEMLSAIQYTDPDPAEEANPIALFPDDLPPIPMMYANPLPDLSSIYLYIDLLEKFEKSQAIIDNSEVGECIITHEAITDYFYRCNKCNQVCSLTAMKEWLKKSQTCPMCREPYKSYPQLYILCSSRTHFTSNP